MARFSPTALRSFAFAALIGLAACSGGGSSLPTLPAGPAQQAAPQTLAQNPQNTVRRTQSARLGTYNIDWSNVAVAGISSGAYMAGQMQVAYAKTYKAMAMFAGGPYFCAQDNLNYALYACSNNIWYDNVPVLEQDTINAAYYGYNDPTSAMSGKKAYLFSGTSDQTVYQSVMQDAKSFYSYFGMNITANFGTNAGHAWISPDVSQACNVTASPYINNCGFDAEQTFLQLFFGTLSGGRNNSGTPKGQLIQFNQNEFSPDGYGPDYLLDQNGYVYVPSTCAAGAKCKLVVAFHGCKQGYAYVGTTFVTKSGLNEWADNNNIIVLYPQAIPSNGYPYNPNGCWDWWGYNASDYADQQGPQVWAVQQMVNRL